MYAIGVMSGTSLDGLDIAYVSFSRDQNKWSYDLLYADTLSYDKGMKRKLEQASSASGVELTALDREYGHYIGERVKEFIQRHHIERVDLIASHGHTITHAPDKGYTIQIGHGGCIRAAVSVPVVCDFRSQDVAMGGQGAPLVPVGDRLLYGVYDACVNLGGFANISYEYKGERIGYDICAINTILNHYVKTLGIDYDHNGEIAQSGEPIPALIDALNSLAYYSLTYPKSLDVSWVHTTMRPVIDDYTTSNDTKDILCSLCHHITQQIYKETKLHSRILFSGGGIKHLYLRSLLKNKLGERMIVPSDEVIDYKEAILFALLGVLRLRGEVNVYKSVTGATKDHCSGTVYV